MDERDLMDMEISDAGAPRTVGVGIHDLPIADYFADPCPEPSLSSSGIRRLLTQTPAHFAAAHPRLTRWPEYARKATKAQDRGSVVHALLLGKGSQFLVKDPTDFVTLKGQPSKTWQGAEAKAWKEEQEAAGFIVLSTEEHSRALSVVGALAEALEKAFGRWPIGHSERTMIWTSETTHGPIYNRALVDHASWGEGIAIDIKTTEFALDDVSLAKKIVNNGDDIQAAFYLDGFNALCPELEGRARFLNVIAEVNPPFGVRVVELPEHWLFPVRARIARMADLFAKCLRANEWPGWPAEAMLEPPGWWMAALEAGELADDQAGVGE